MRTAYKNLIVRSDNRVLFTYSGTAKTVALAASFSNWQPIPMQPHGAQWVIETGPLSIGLYAYKWVIDGQWMQDRDNPLQQNDGMGGHNSVFGVIGPLEDEFRVLSLNLHSYQEQNALEKLQWISIFSAAMGVDILLLQEVAAHQTDPRYPNAGDLLKGHLERDTQKNWFHFWGRAHLGFDVYEEGLSILASLPLMDAHRVQLSTGPLARIGVLAKLNVQGVTTWVGSTHLSWEAAAGLKEADVLRKTLGEGVALITGDFNALAHQAPVLCFTKNGFRDMGAAMKETQATFLGGSAGRIDFHLGRGWVPCAFWRVLDGQLGPRVSDHAGLLGVYTREAP